MQSRYVEVHMEQGPVLETLGQPLGVVTAIAGQSRLAVTIEGMQARLTRFCLAFTTHFQRMSLSID